MTFVISGWVCGLVDGGHMVVLHGGAKVAGRRWTGEVSGLMVTCSAMCRPSESKVDDMDLRTIDSKGTYTTTTQDRSCS